MKRTFGTKISTSKNQAEKIIQLKAQAVSYEKKKNNSEGNSNSLEGNTLSYGE